MWNEGNQIYILIVYCVFVRIFVIPYRTILLWFWFRLFNKLRFRFRFHTAKRVTVPTVLVWVAQHCLVGTGGEAGGGHRASLAADHRLRHLCNRVQDFNNLMGFTSKKLPNNSLKNDCQKRFSIGEAITCEFAFFFILKRTYTICTQWPPKNLNVFLHMSIQKTQNFTLK